MTNSHSPIAADVGLVPDAQSTTLQTLPVELLADIFSELDLDSLIVVSCLSRRLRAVIADVSLNPWRRPILRSLHQRIYDKSLCHLSVRSIVPRRNWIEILTFASPSFLLFHSTLPNLKSLEWEECFRRRFLPGWTKWKKDNSWRETFIKMLYRVWHRSRSPCTSDESWTKYVVINRNGSVNELEAASRSFNPLAIFHEMKVQSNLVNLPTQIRFVLQLTDVRILALGVVDHPRTPLMVNRNAHAFLYPPRLEPPGVSVDLKGLTSYPNVSDSSPSGMFLSCPQSNLGTHLVSTHSVTAYHRLSRPMPSHIHNNYPMFTPGGGDQRWHPDAVLGEGMQWVGGLMVTAQLYPSDPHGPAAHGLERLELVDHAQFASFTWGDFLAIAPWMEKRTKKCIYGQGLGIQ